jgi:hypothetical protein
MIDITEILKVIPIISIIISVTSLTIVIINSWRDKYKIRRDYFEGIIKWHRECVEVIISLRYESSSDSYKSTCVKLLPKLSALIEQGRFYFPNILTGNNFGREKPFAYQGLRNLALDMLVVCYNIFEHHDGKKPETNSLRYQRQFTSIVVEIYNAAGIHEKLYEFSNKYPGTKQTIEDYIKEDKEVLVFHS